MDHPGRVSHFHFLFGFHFHLVIMKRTKCYHRKGQIAKQYGRCPKTEDFVDLGGAKVENSLEEASDSLACEF